MTPRSLVGIALTGAVTLAAWGAAEFSAFYVSPTEQTAASAAKRQPATLSESAVVAAPEPAVVAAPAPAVAPEPAVVTAAAPASAAAPADANPTASVVAPASAVAQADANPTASIVAPVTSPAAEAPAVAPAVTEPGTKPAPDTDMHLASVLPSAPVDEGAKPPVQSIEPPHACETDACIDAYLWSLYERTPKVDTNKVTEQIKVTVKRKGKTRTVTQTTTSFVVGDFTWKDPAAAQRAGLSLMDYVIGGMDPAFRRRLYGALRAMDDAGLMPGITSGFRDDYRQTIAAGNKAAPDRSYHGGSMRGGYGHGLAADIVSVKGANRMERYAASEELWKWVDAHGKEVGIGRPYLDFDPPHVGPIDGTEYIVKRGLAAAQKRAAQAKAADKARSKAAKPPAAHADAGATKHANAGATKHAVPAKLAKLSTPQKRTAVAR
jgi:hypothetical protein